MEVSSVFCALILEALTNRSTPFRRTSTTILIDKCSVIIRAAYEQQGGSRIISRLLEQALIAASGRCHLIGCRIFNQCHLTSHHQGALKSLPHLHQGTFDMVASILGEWGAGTLTFEQLSIGLGYIANFEHHRSFYHI